MKIVTWTMVTGETHTATMNAKAAQDFMMALSVNDRIKSFGAKAA